MRGVDDSHTAVALDYALVGGHLGRLVVGAIRFTNCSALALAVVRILPEPLTNLCGIVLHPLDPLKRLGLDIRFAGSGIVELMTIEHRACRPFHLLRL